VNQTLEKTRLKKNAEMRKKNGKTTLFKTLLKKPFFFKKVETIVLNNYFKQIFLNKTVESIKILRMKF